MCFGEGSGTGGGIFNFVHKPARIMENKSLWMVPTCSVSGHEFELVDELDAGHQERQGLARSSLGAADQVFALE